MEVTLLPADQTLFDQLVFKWGAVWVSLSPVISQFQFVPQLFYTQRMNNRNHAITSIGSRTKRARADFYYGVRKLNMLLSFVLFSRSECLFSVWLKQKLSVLSDPDVRPAGCFVVLEFVLKPLSRLLSGCTLCTLLLLVCLAVGAFCGLAQL